MRGIAVVLLVLGLLWPLGGAAQLPDGLAGSWVGTVESDAREGQVRIALQAQGDGFELELALPGVPPVRAQMVASELPRVYQTAAAPRGIFSFFEGAGRTDPFDGVPLIWARTTATSIVAYRLAIAANGGMGLVRIAVEPLEEGLQMRVEERVDTRPPARWQAQLERQG